MRHGEMLLWLALAALIAVGLSLDNATVAAWVNGL